MKPIVNNYPITWQKSIVRNFCEVPLGKSSGYQSIELQRVQKGSVSGFVALLNYGNKELDILFENQLALDDFWVSTEPATAHMKIRNLQSVEFQNVSCNVSSSEVTATAIFKDIEGRLVDFQVNHRFGLMNKPMFTPAPPQVDPYCLRFMAMDVFHLLPKYSDIRVSFDGSDQPIEPFLLPGKLALYSSTRVGSSFLLSSLVPVGEVTSQGSSTSVVTLDGLMISDEEMWMKVVGLPSVEELNSLDNGKKCQGDFEVHSPLGRLAHGRFYCEVTDDQLLFELRKVRQDWSPGMMSPARSAMRLIRNHNRRAENWLFKSIGTRAADGSWVYKGHWSNDP